jgi:hypothetical protein
VASARDASLLIRDGDQQHALKLSSAELRAGEVVYQPVSSDVVLRLEIDDGAGRRATETTSVLGLTPRLGRVARPPRTPLPARQLRAAAKPQPKPVAPPPARPQHRPAPRAPEQDHFSTPEPYPAALSSIVGTVRVDARVTTDARGDVRRAELVSPGPSAYFAKLALEAARASRLRPGAESAVLHYEFTPDGVRITRLQGAPAGAR